MDFLKYILQRGLESAPNTAVLPRFQKIPKHQQTDLVHGFSGCKAFSSTFNTHIMFYKERLKGTIFLTSQNFEKIKEQTSKARLTNVKLF